MNTLIEITGQRFGKLTVLGYAGSNKHGKATWHVKCDCGNDAIVIGSRMRIGETNSCGCLQRQALAKTITKHGQHGTRAYNAWVAMKSRCHNANNKSYAYYGGRGIKVSERWNDFANFHADMGDPTPGMTLDRIDNAGDYRPGNCRWATRKQQGRNKRNNLNITFDGKTMALPEWCELLGLSYDMVYARLHALGWTVERALGTCPADAR